MVRRIRIKARKDLNAQIGLSTGGEDIDHLKGDDQGGIERQQAEHGYSGDHRYMEALTQWRPRCPGVRPLRPFKWGKFSAQTVPPGMREAFSGLAQGRQNAGERSRNRSIIIYGDLV